MNNIASEPSLLLPEIPTNFESLCGTSRTDFAKALFELISAAQITGVNVEPTPYDLAAMNDQLQTIQSNVDTLMLRKIAEKTISVTSNTEALVVFDDVGTTNYTVTAVYTSLTGVNIPTVTWSVIQGSKTTNSVKIRQDGAAGANMTMDVCIWVLGQVT